MKTKIFISLFVLFFSAAALTAQEEKTMYVMKDGAVTHKIAASEIDSLVFIDDPLTFDKWVMINGVKWATRNVSSPGTFAATPEASGMFYQWNRTVGWPAIGKVTNWDDSTPSGTTWEKANDPSPAGFRVPTLPEIQSLLDTTYVTTEVTTRNDVYGREFTDRSSGESIFLPAAGFRGGDGKPYKVGDEGDYWSSTQYNSNSACGLFFVNYYVIWSYGSRINGLSVRPVAE